MEEKKSWKENPWVRGIATFLAVSMILGIVGQGVYLRIQQRRAEKQQARLEAAALEDRKAREAYDTAYALAGQAAEAGDYPGAVVQIEKCLSMAEPESPTEKDLRLTLVSLQMLCGESEAALPELTALTEEEPENPDLLLMRAQARLDTGNEAGAVEDLEAYLKLKPGDGEVTSSLAMLYEGRGNYQEAAERYKSLMTLSPETPGASLNAARCLILGQDYPGAEKLLQGLLEKDPESPDRGTIHFLLGMSRMQQGMVEQAAGEYELSMEAGYDRTLCLPQLAACRFVLGDYQGVIAAGQQYLDLPEASAGNAGLYQQMGISAFALQQTDQAIEYLAEALRADETYPGSYFYRGLCYLSQENWNQAAYEFGKSIDQDYLPADSHYNRGLCYARMDRYDWAIRDMEMTLQHPEDPELCRSAEEFLPILRQEQQRNRGETA